MSTVEIEDVLSSIRRLVSEDLRVAPPADPPRKPVPRLMLTQALRVDAPRAEGPLQLVQPTVPADGTCARPADLREWAGEVRQADPAGAPPPAPGLPDEAPVADSAADFAADGAAPELAARLAELEAILDAQEQAFDDEAGAALEAPVALHRLAEVPEAPFHDDTLHALPEPEVAVLFPARAPQAVLRVEEDTGTAPEVLAARRSEAAFDPAPQVAARAPQGPEFTAPQTGIRSGAVPEDAAMFSWTEAPAAASPAHDPGAQDDLPLLDEDTLRALIRDVLREELQGEIGARVTRNLRKMIRTEIARALTARGIV